MNELFAYRAMFQFLADRYKRLPSDDLGGLLGEMQLATDGLPFDPAIRQEWDQAIAAVHEAEQRATKPLRMAS